jgi:hypothetical protein
MSRTPELQENDDEAWNEENTDYESVPLTPQQILEMEQRIEELQLQQQEEIYNQEKMYDIVLQNLNNLACTNNQLGVLPEIPHMRVICTNNQLVMPKMPSKPAPIHFDSAEAALEHKKQIDRRRQERYRNQHRETINQRKRELTAELKRLREAEHQREERREAEANNEENNEPNYQDQNYDDHMPDNDEPPHHDDEPPHQDDEPVPQTLPVDEVIRIVSALPEYADVEQGTRGTKKVKINDLKRLREITQEDDYLKIIQNYERTIRAVLTSRKKKAESTKQTLVSAS